MPSEDTQRGGITNWLREFVEGYRSIVAYSYEKHGLVAAVFAVIAGPLFVIAALEVTEVPKDAKNVE